MRRRGVLIAASAFVVASATLWWRYHDSASSHQEALRPNEPDAQGSVVPETVDAEELPTAVVEPVLAAAPQVVTSPADALAARCLVEDEVGKPVAGAVIKIEALLPQGDGERLLAEGKSELDGTVHFESVRVPPRDSRTIISANHDGYAGAGIEVDLRTSELFRLVLESSRSLLGRVHDQDGHGIPSATIEPWWIRSSAGTALLTSSERGRLQALTDSNGEFKIHGLPCGTVHLVVRAKGWATRRCDVTVSADGGTVDLTLVKGCSVSGHVFVENTKTGVAGVLLGARNQQGGDGFWSQVVTDEGGRYEINGLRGGDGVRGGLWNIIVIGPSSITTNWTSVAVDGLDLREGEERRDVDLYLVRGGTLLVRVVAADSQTPVSDVRVRMHSLARPRSGADFESAFTNASGEARWRVPAGDAETWIQHAVGMTEGFLDVSPPRVKSVSIHPDAVTEVTFQLNRAGSVDGIVIDERGAPVVGATVIRLGVASGPCLSKSRVQTDKEGHFSLSGFALGSTMTLTAETDDLGMPTPASVEPQAAGTIGQITLQLQQRPRTSLHGRILYSNGMPATCAVVIEETLANGEVVPRRPEPENIGYGSDGRFHFFGVWPNHRYRVVCETSDLKLVGKVSASSNYVTAGDEDIDVGDLVLK